MNLAGNITNFFNGFIRGQSTFALYTMDSLTSTTPVKAIIFDGIMSLSYSSQINIAYETLENSQFSSDSWQDTPDTLKIQVVNNPKLNNISDNITLLKQYEKSTTILALLQIYPLYSPYLNMKLFNFTYEQDTNRTIPFFNLSFQEIRTTTAQYGGLQQTQVSNANNSSRVDTGLNSPQSPSGDTSTLVSN